jgi:hypothetical protein
MNSTELVYWVKIVGKIRVRVCAVRKIREDVI